ncbi:TIGR02680 family protein [Verrucosispora sp. WMMA2044]|uniref:TIGR02680 family protein n=1 Tax=unclassified Micromonospora TaxID=2617518 RepID=UPI0022B7066A|nr:MULTISPECIES: TIGR02680 family protein [unclassified Micromonospora]MCZ7421080.1 TIGR02680 family protein [Verrucosispora sp. WMMA2121]WBB47784.1 TIGR02680 family protein [Verrucosispora sp. WMMA2044]
MIEQRGIRRFAPTRAGIINLWDYRDEEFSFVDGWLVLRGPNGSGKTKALEVLFPFVLDGRIEPRRLNPFASEDRTMKSNLLYRGQEVTHAYVWMEFGDGTHYVTVGIGLRAHRHVDRVTRWHFVVDGRVGVDFSLLDFDDRPLTRRDLIDRLGADAVRDSAEDYRQLIDARLFGLGPARYEQLLDLVLTLRKPQLAKDLNPVELSRTLQRGLRPVEDHLLVEAARSFDDMEAVARTLEGLVAADGATAAFLTVYSTYLRTHARVAADALTARRDAVATRSTALGDARASAEAAAEAESTADERLRAVEGEPGRLRAHLDSLKASTAYQSHEQLADLQRHVHDLAEAAGRADEAVAAEESMAARRRTESERATVAARDTRTAADRLAADLLLDAETAGITWRAEDAAPDDLAARITARAAARRDDVRALRAQVARHDQADRDHARAAADAAGATSAAADAEQAERRAEDAVAQARARLRAEIEQWAQGNAGLLADLARPDLAAGLSAVVDTTGEPGARTLREVYAEATATTVTQRRDRLAALAAQRTALADRRAEVAAERDRIAAEHDDAPPVPVTRPAPRTGRPGAPLWRLVRFADGVTGANAATVEAALHAAGLLDAWLHPDPGTAATALAGDDLDAYLLPLPPHRRPTGATLADVLTPEEQDDVPAARITEVLTSVALADVTTPAAAPVTIGVDGRYAQGISAGRFAKVSCEYIGATARAARRAARVSECDRLVAVIDADADAVDRERATVEALLAAVDAAAAHLPATAPVHTALRELDRAAATLRARQEASAATAARLDQALAERAAAVAALRRRAAERSLPVDRLDDTAEAVSRFERGGVRLEGARTAAARAAEQEDQARQRHDEAVDRLTAATETARTARARHQEKAEAYRTLRDSVGADAERVLADVARTADAITEAEQAVEQARTALGAARERRVAALTRVELGEQALVVAVAEAQHDAQRLRPYAQPDLLSLLRCPTDLRWPAQTSDDELHPQVAALHEAILTATRELSPTETSLKQSATRLTSALTDLQAQLPAAGLDHRPEWDTDDGVIVVRVADEQGLTPVAHFADRITRERRDQEQLLTDSEQRVLEDALLGQLARQIHHRTIEARDLVAAMDSQMRARRMSSGLTVGVGWRLADDLDTEQRDVCKLLERDPARLGPGQLTTMRRHFAARIKTARAAAPERPYRELLGDVLDYRQWRTFAFTLHRPGGGTEALTRARHSQLSGGEQSVSLHLPLFAAANALFGSARPDAPRLLGLDEAFAGVDDTGRGELMALAKQFDLDLFMTGYDLWATHPAVSGAAHYDLSHSAVEHAVSTVLLVWDGSTNIADFDGTLARALGSPETRRAPAGHGEADRTGVLLDLTDE